MTENDVRRFFAIMKQPRTCDPQQLPWTDLCGFLFFWHLSFRMTDSNRFRAWTLDCVARAMAGVIIGPDNQAVDRAGTLIHIAAQAGVVEHDGNSKWRWSFIDTNAN